MKEERLEQLKTIFKSKIEEIINDVKNMHSYFESKNSEYYVKNKADQLVYEVKIRINNKEGR